jgi:hypothetical protein
MIEKIRKSFNQSFKQESYVALLDEIDHVYPNALEFRIAETPIFIPKLLTDQMVNTCDFIIDFIKSNDFKSYTNQSIPKDEFIKNENTHPHFIAFDFGICKNERNELYPALIEMQGFPSLFGFQAFYPEILEKHFKIQDNLEHYFNKHNKESYIEELRKLIVGEHDPINVILLELKPHEQKTRIDFYCTETYLGIKTVCLTELKIENNNIYYILNGIKTQVKRIYNRIIFDELNRMNEKLGELPNLHGDINVEWIGHPNWFYRISKYTLPFLKHPNIPETYFLNEIKQIPTNLEEYVLKPLFSYAGQGVIIDLKEADLINIEDPENWILQRKVNYADCIETPDGPAKTEIRLMYTWQDGDDNPTLLTNLARISKGKMIGTRYNDNNTWVGGTVAYIES